MSLFDRIAVAPLRRLHTTLANQLLNQRPAMEFRAHGVTLELCLSYLRLREVCLSSRVSRTWYKAADSTLVWKAILSASFQPYSNAEKVITCLHLPLPRKDGVSWYYEDEKYAEFLRTLQSSPPTSRWHFASILAWISSRLTYALNGFRRIKPPRRYFEDHPHEWLTSTLCRKHLPVTLYFTMGHALFPLELHDADLEQQRQQQILSDLTTFGNALNVQVWNGGGDRENFFALLFKHPSLQRIRTLTMRTTEWMTPAILQQVCQLRFLHKLSLGADHAKSNSSPIKMLESPFDALKLCESLRTIWIYDIVEDDDLSLWSCLKHLPGLETLYLQRGSIGWRPPPNFGELSTEWGIQHIQSLNLGLPLVGLTVKQWTDFLTPLTSLRRFQCEGFEPFALIQSLSEIAGPCMSTLTELRWVICDIDDGTRGSPDEFIEQYVQNWEAKIATMEENLLRLYQRLPKLRIRFIIPTDEWPWSKQEISPLFEQMPSRFADSPNVSVSLDYEDDSIQ